MSVNFHLRYPSFMDIQPIVTSDNGNKGSGRESDKGGSNDNNHRSSKNKGSNRGSNRVGGNNMAALSVNNTLPPTEGDGIGQ